MITATGEFWILNDIAGPSSHMHFVQSVYQRIHQETHQTLLGPQNQPVPGGLQKWGLERYIFSAPYDGPLSSSGRFLDRAKGDRFINAYFNYLHPQMPIICRSDILATWEALWTAPSRDEINSKGILFLVLALGARVAHPEIGETPASLEKWAEYFSHQTNDFSTLFQEPSFKNLQFLILKVGGFPTWIMI